MVADFSVCIVFSLYRHNKTLFDIPVYQCLATPREKANGQIDKAETMQYHLRTLPSATNKTAGVGEYGEPSGSKHRTGHRMHSGRNTCNSDCISNRLLCNPVTNLPY